MTVVNVSARTEVLLRLAMPVAIVVAALVIYRGMTKPFDECTKGSMSLSETIGGASRSSWNEATAQVECGRRH